MYRFAITDETEIRNILENKSSKGNIIVRAI